MGLLLDDKMKIVGRGKFGADALFFIEDGRKKYVVYTLPDGAVWAASFRGRNWRRRAREVGGDDPILDHVRLLAERYMEGDEQIECDGETYIIKRKPDGVKYSKKWIFRGRVNTLPIVLVFFTLGFLGFYAFGTGNDIPEAPDYQEVVERLPSEAEYLENISKGLDDDIWPTLSTDEKMELLRQVCDWETVNVLGCSPVNVQHDEFDEHMLGFFRPVDQSIYLNSALVEQGGWRECVETLVHECRHCWQRDMMKLLGKTEKWGGQLDNLYIFDDVREFREAWDNYEDGFEDFDKYYSQSVEQDSRQWAVSRMLEYYYPNLLDKKQ